MRGRKGFIDIDMLLIQNTMGSLGIGECEIFDVVISICHERPLFEISDGRSKIKLYDAVYTHDVGVEVESEVPSATTNGSKCSK